MRKPSTPGITPQGGWKYTDPDNGVAFRAQSVDVIVAKVRASRLGNDLMVGAAWLIKFYDELCEQNPQAPCANRNEQAVRWNSDDMTAFVSTLSTMRQSGLSQVDQEEYDRRMSICLRCPKQGYVSCSWCGGFAQKLQEVVAGVKIKDTELYSKACLACGCNVAAKSAYPLEVLQEVDQKLGRQPDYWEQCWMRE